MVAGGIGQYGRKPLRSPRRRASDLGFFGGPFFERKDAKTQRRKDFDSELCVLASLRLSVLASLRLGVSLSDGVSFLIRWRNETLNIRFACAVKTSLKKQEFQMKPQGQIWDIVQ